LSPRIFFLESVVQPRIVGELVLIGHLPVDQALDLPLRGPDVVVPAVEHLVSPTQNNSSPITLAKNFGRAYISPPTTTDNPAYTFGSCTAMKQKSSIAAAHVLDDEVQPLERRRGSIYIAHVERVLVQRPDRRTLCTWTFLIPSSCDFSRNRNASGSRNVQPREPCRHSAVYSFTPVKFVALMVLFQLLDAGVALARIPPAVHDQLPGVPLRESTVALERIEAVPVPLLQVRGLEDRHIHVALVEDVPDEVLLGTFR